MYFCVLFEIPDAFHPQLDCITLLQDIHTQNFQNIDYNVMGLHKSINNILANVGACNCKGLHTASSTTE